MHRRQFIAATAAALASAGSRAQALPSGPIRIVVGFPAGGGTDVLARLLAQKLAPMWNAAVIVDNRAGAAGLIAADHVAKSPADGRTLLMAHINSHGIAPGLHPRLPYAADTDFSAIALIGATPQMIVCGDAQAVKTFDGLLALCRSQPGRVSFGSAGIGSAQHLALELLKARAGIDTLHVPYKGSAPLVTDLIGSQVQYAFEGMTTATPQLKSGRLVALAQTRLVRSKSHPGVPTVAELGLGGFDASIWFGLVGPAGLPGALVQRMNADVNTVLALPEVAEKLEQFGAEDGGGSAERFAGFMQAEQRKWARIVKDANIKPEA